MQPEQLALQVRVSSTDRPQLEQATAGLDQFPKLVKLMSSIPVKLLEAGRSHEVDLPPDTGGQYTCHGCERTEDQKQWLTRIRLNLDVAPLVNKLQIWNRSARAMGETSNFTFSVPYPQMNTALLVHEFSHHLMHHLDKHQLAILDEAGSASYSAKHAVSDYAFSDEAEWFAETFTAYIFKPQELKEFDPLAYIAMEAAIEGTGTGA